MWSTRDVMKHVSEQWAALPKQDKNQYAEQANQDKKRFEQELNLLRTSKVVGYEPTLPKRPLEAKSLRVAMEQAA